ncbi:hypothetical protein FXF61_14525 [Pseudomonas sp. C27(2019)]|mgnify:CR=1 FL=1|uniref:hypothetical protein n=1 Tax=Pseudomonas sp. C27(2019) TaxID=2604941 RepID=UPI001244AB9A|nr:hypothetical protein [Pseudomonas sp. C27(2019)]QEY60277.1 hypothetical protein FXF61_14525 [Pseudomonas sp. C27(2019)]
MNYRLALTVIVMLFITGCASPVRFVGMSVGDHVVRKDVYKHVAFFFRAQYGCSKIDTIYTKPTHIAQTESGVFIQARELWAVRGCNKEAVYDIRLKSDANRETDFTVSTFNKASNSQ